MSLPRYPEYRDSGTAWLGRVPAHWERSKLKYVATFSGGGTPNRDVPEYWNGDIPWVSPKDMKAESIQGAEECITESGLSNSTANLIEPGHVLMVVRSGILKHTIPVAINRVPVALNQDMKAISMDRTRCEPAFFARWVQGLNDDLLLAWAKQGATVESIEQAYLADTSLPLPPISEQRDICRFLDHETAKIDALIAEQEKLIALLAEKRQATISHAVTRGLNPDAPMKDSGVPWLGEVPAHWEVLRVKDVARLESGHTPSKQVAEYWEDCDIPWVSLNDSKWLAANDYISETAVKINHLGLENSSARMLPPGAVVFTRDATIGLAAITTLSMAVSQHLIAWCPSARIKSEYLLRVFNAMKPHLDAHTFGATIKTIGMADVKKLVTPLPPLAEQAAIAEYLERSLGLIDASCATAERAVELLRERRAALIAAAVTGQIDVRGWQAKPASGGTA
ncbi:MAG: restriction endonuclease subunit S [Roseateles asaccharophilus]|uniref:restriction endonuclease subunit S n=1 Tax=Roseateles asaccharophilus TaxID=582607 RepID=UPI00391A789F